jgi:hypothetical protein
MLHAEPVRHVPTGGEGVIQRSSHARAASMSAGRDLSKLMLTTP